MNASDLLRHNVTFTHGITKAYVADITEDEMLVRAVEGSNHLAWQLGHLVASEQSLLRAIGCDAPDLPDGFVEAHDKSTIDCNDAGRFRTKDEYLALMDQMHEAAIAAIDKTTEAELDASTPEKLRSFFPTVGSVLMMMGGHEMMHAGQIAAIRRKLGKPVVI